MRRTPRSAERFRIFPDAWNFLEIGDSRQSLNCRGTAHEERRTSNPRVAGSNPAGRIRSTCKEKLFRSVYVETGTGLPADVFLSEIRLRGSPEGRLRFLRALAREPLLVTLGSVGVHGISGQTQLRSKG